MRGIRRQWRESEDGSDCQERTSQNNGWFATDCIMLFLALSDFALQLSGKVSESFSSQPHQTVTIAGDTPISLPPLSPF